ncbi:hypothetical protein [Paraburkholderia sp. 22B1P]
MKLLLCFVGLNCKVLLHLARFRMLKTPSIKALSRTLNFTVC